MKISTITITVTTQDDDTFSFSSKAGPYVDGIKAVKPPDGVTAEITIGNPHTPKAPRKPKVGTGDEIPSHMKRTS